ncbi:unnamed protein product [marine sediment metagenome]|uniref:Uncharacterized protein n=1 Tax=marine sediment metagenome TaxID=412755 RepID=X1AIX6_9ZZZZ
MKNNLKLISFDNLDIKQIELKESNNPNIWKWKYTKRLINLNPVNNKKYTVIMVLCETDIDIYYCFKVDRIYSIHEINRYYFEFMEVDYLEMEII